MTDRDIRTILNNCTKFLNYHYPVSAKSALTELAETIPDFTQVDHYGNGSVVADFEIELAELLGKPAALFMPTGTMSQQIALRIWSERKNNRTVVWHPTCHLEIHENSAYRELHSLRGMSIGSSSDLMTLQDLQEIRFPFKTLLIELPQREIGGILPSWEALMEMVDWAHKEDMAVHLDGARLWETKVFYGREYAEIVALFDSVYVSFYKMMQGVAGAALLGDEEFIGEARIWRHRHGGNIFGMYPMVLSAKQGMAKHLPQMDAYCQRARDVAEILSVFPEIEIKPNPPHTNMMKIYIRGNKEQLTDAVLDIAEETGFFILRGLQPAPIPNYVMSEMVMGNASLDLDLSEIEAAFHDLLERAKM